MRCISIHIHGMVQGVGFRWAAKCAADRLGLCGFVRNESDGTVYVAVEGEPTAIETFVAWCHEGPPPSRVDRVAIEYCAPRQLPSFEIR